LGDILPPVKPSKTQTFHSNAEYGTYHLNRRSDCNLRVADA
jgi:hypothetical protein